MAALIQYKVVCSAFEKISEDEGTSEFQRALALLNESRRVFISAPVASATGAVLKLHWLIEEAIEGHVIDVAQADGFHRPALDSVLGFLMVNA